MSQPDNQATAEATAYERKGIPLSEESRAPALRSPIKAACQRGCEPASCFLMNNRIGIIILLVICLGLGVAVVTVKKRAADQHDQDARNIGTASNELVKAS